MNFFSNEEARNRLLDFGRDPEVLRPLAPRRSILDFVTKVKILLGQQTLNHCINKLWS
jgi:hypothetical protein